MRRLEGVAGGGSHFTAFPLFSGSFCPWYCPFKAPGEALWEMVVGCVVFLHTILPRPPLTSSPLLEKCRRPSEFHPMSGKKPSLSPTPTPCLACTKDTRWLSGRTKKRRTAAQHLLLSCPGKAWRVTPSSDAAPLARFSSCWLP